MSILNRTSLLNTHLHAQEKVLRLYTNRHPKAIFTLTLLQDYSRRPRLS